MIRTSVSDDMRSVTAPATGERIRIGTRSAAATTPSHTVEFVSSQASQPTPTRCIHEEIAAGVSPAMNNA